MHFAGEALKAVKFCCVLLMRGSIDKIACSAMACIHHQQEFTIVGLEISSEVV